MGHGLLISDDSQQLSGGGVFDNSGFIYNKKLRISPTNTASEPRNRPGNLTTKLPSVKQFLNEASTKKRFPIAGDKAESESKRSRSVLAGE